MSDIQMAKCWEQGGTVQNAKALLRGLIADAKKLVEVVALVDSWMDGYGSGTKAENVMVVSIEFLHKQVHAITDPT